MKMPLVPTIAATLAAFLYLPAFAVDDYTLHEWGTFTTVIGSDGTHLDGVYREDAPLPKFVYQLDVPPRIAPGVRLMTKGLSYSRTFAHVNVRLETPVIYFYTNKAFDAQVDVGFKNGTIGQWYPDRSAGEQRQRQPLLDFAKPREGSIRWNVHVEPAGEDQSSRVFRSGELPCWLYPRYPDSALVTNAKKETEKYLFYRGLGRMELPVVFTASDRELHAANRGKNEIAQWLVFQLNEKGDARWWLPDFIAAEIGSVTVPLDNQPYRADWKKALYADGLKMLMDAGLYRKEADAMMQTWWTSYFETSGLRVFWIVPRAKVDEILPLKVLPAPKDTERVIVGRSEILSPSFERRLVSDFAAVNGRERGNRWASDRFFPAYSARVKQLNAAVPIVAAKMPVGKWKVNFVNGIVQTYEIREDGSASVAHPELNATGEAEVKHKYVEIRFESDRAERWTLRGDTMTVQHWFPSSEMPNGNSVTGNAVRIDQPAGQVTWNDRISAAKIGVNARVLAFENANFEGAEIVLNGTGIGKETDGNYPLLLNLNNGLEFSATWNDRITSIKVIDGRNGVSGKATSDGVDLNDQVVFFENSHFQGGSFKLSIGAEIRDLTAMKPSPSS